MAISYDPEQGKLMTSPPTNSGTRQNNAASPAHLKDSDRNEYMMYTTPNKRAKVSSGIDTKDIRKTMLDLIDQLQEPHISPSRLVIIAACNLSATIKLLEGIRLSALQESDGNMTPGNNTLTPLTETSAASGVSTPGNKSERWADATDDLEEYNCIVKYGIIPAEIDMGKWKTLLTDTEIAQNDMRSKTIPKGSEHYVQDGWSEDCTVHQVKYGRVGEQDLSKHEAKPIPVPEALVNAVSVAPICPEILSIEGYTKLSWTNFKSKGVLLVNILQAGNNNAGDA